MGVQWRKWHKRLVLFIGVGVLMVACGADASPAIIVEVSRTPTPSQTPSLTPAPVIITQPPPTLGPTWTRPAPEADSAGPTPTSPLRPTFTLPPPTVTPTRPPATATPDILVEYFRSNRDTVSPSGNVTLSWSVVGARTITIYRLDANGLRERQWPVDAQGQLTVSTNAVEQAVFSLVAEADTLSVERTLTLQITCGSPWFFAPPPTECPTEAPVLTLQVEQRFERGSMIWVAATQEIFVFFEDGTTDDGFNTWVKYPDNYTDDQPDRDPAIVPPDGFFQPVRGFGLVWRSFENVRDRLGWAVEPEAPYDGALQLSTTTTYLRNRNSGIIALQNNTLQWSILEAFPTEFESPTEDATPTPSAS